MIKGCIFDLDGVVVDTAHYHYLAWKRLAHQMGHNLTERENERLKGVSRMQSLDIVLELAGVTLTQEHKQLLAEKKNTWFNEYVSQMTPTEILPGVLSLIHNLRKENIAIGLASSSKNAQTVLRQLQLEDEFDVVVDGSMIDKTKPDPEIFLVTASRMGVKPAACVVIEDAEAGVDAALAAGMKCIGIGSTVLLGKAHMVFSRTGDVNLDVLRHLEEIRQ